MEQNTQKPPTANPITAAALFIGLCNLRATEGTLRWQGAQLGFLLNLPAMGTVLFKLSATPSAKDLIFISLGSFVCCVIDWFLYEVIKRDGKNVDLWNDLLVQLENSNGADGNMRVFSSSLHLGLRSSRGRLQDRLQALVIGCIVVWGAVAIFALGMIFGVKP